MEIVLVLQRLLVFVTIFSSTSGYIDTLYGKQSSKEEYDYIVVGGGSAGSVIANRLSEDGESTVLLLEAGGAPPGIFDVPLSVLQAIGKPETDWMYYTETQTKACLGLTEQRSFWTRAKMLGGCSTHNGMMYVRGNRRDYDNWAENSGATGWSWDQVFPLFMKSEAVTDTELLQGGIHGNSGYLNVSQLAFETPLADAYVRAGESLGYSSKLDYNDGSPLGFYKLIVTQVDGRRCSTEKAFLRKFVTRPNLDILVNSQVTRVRFNGSNANGVEFVQNNQTKIVKAQKEVILSAGTIGSPQILMLSGIGPESLLKQFQIEVVSNLPVGENLQDHAGSFLYYLLNESVMITLADINIDSIGKFVEGKGPLTLPSGFEGIGFVNSKYQNETENWPDIEILFAPSFGIPPNTFNESINEQLKEYTTKNVLTALPLLLRPRSRGSIKLRSKSPFDQPVIDPRYFDDEEDLNRFVEGIKIISQFMKSEPMQRFSPKRIPDVLSGCEGLDTESDDYLKCIAQTLTMTVYHPVGTCKMGSASDESAVVDPQLRVKGVTGLRVADASIMPTITSGNTNAPTIMIGEKAAEMIRNGV